jgi:integrase
MVYTFSRVGAAVSMKVEDYFVQGRRGWVRLHEKGGKEHEMPTHHNLDRYLEEYISAAGIAQDRKGPLFRTTRGRSGELTGNASPVRCVADDSPASCSGRHQDRDRLSHLSRHRHHGLSKKWWKAGDRSTDGRA